MHIHVHIQDCCNDFSIQIFTCTCTQVVITTPTSSATGYYLLHYDDISQASMTVEPQKVNIVVV